MRLVKTTNLVILVSALIFSGCGAADEKSEIKVKGVAKHVPAYPIQSVQVMNVSEGETVEGGVIYQAAAEEQCVDLKPIIFSMSEKVMTQKLQPMLAIIPGSAKAKIRYRAFSAPQVGPGINDQPPLELATGTNGRIELLLQSEKLGLNAQRNTADPVTIELFSAEDKESKYLGCLRVTFQTVMADPYLYYEFARNSFDQLITFREEVFSYPNSGGLVIKNTNSVPMNYEFWGVIKDSANGVPYDTCFRIEPQIVGRCSDQAIHSGTLHPGEKVVVGIKGGIRAHAGSQQYRFKSVGLQLEYQVGASLTGMPHVPAYLSPLKTGNLN